MRGHRVCSPIKPFLNDFRHLFFFFFFCLARISLAIFEGDKHRVR